MVKMCCVPYCNEISKSKFNVPKNNELRSLWEKSLNLKLKPTSKVCEKHFDVNDVIKTWESGKGFSKYTICLKIPKLRPGAIPKLTVVNETINDVLQNAVLDISPPKKRKIHDENSMTYNVLNDHSYSTMNDSKSSNNSTSIFEDNISNFDEHLFSSTITSELETTKKKKNVSSTLFEANPLFISICKSINLINVPLKWFVDINKLYGTAENVVCFHKLTLFSENLLRSIEKQLVLSKVFVCIFNSILDYCCCIKTLDLINIQFTMQNLQETLISNSCEPEKFKYEKWSYTEIFDKIQKFRKHKVFCDIKLATEEGNIIFGHKAVLASASPYLHAVFLLQHDKDTVVIEQLDCTTLQLMVDFMYSGKILVTEKNVQALLPAANLLFLNDVKEACCEFLQKQLNPTNCLGINALADKYSCTELLSISEVYIRQHFLEVVEADEFLCLSSTQIVKLISSDKLNMFLSEKEMFEYVIRWVKHELGSRKSILPQLLELIHQPIAIQEDIQRNPSQSDGLQKVIFVVAAFKCKTIGGTEWFDQKINQWKFGPDIISDYPRRHPSVGTCILKDNMLFNVGSCALTSYRSVEVLDLSSESPRWKPSVNLLVKRKEAGVGVIQNDLYAVGGSGGFGINSENSAEVLKGNTQEWRMVSSMSTRRSSLGVGVLNNLLYAVGGYNDETDKVLNSVECYDPTTDSWTSIAKMQVRRCSVGVGVLDGILYAVGGYDGSKTLRSVETYSSSRGIWTSIADMHLCRKYSGVVALGGLLYVIGGSDGTCNLKSVEMYNPKTNTWTMLTALPYGEPCYGCTLVIDKPPYF